ncbi:MAG: hypothetical protein PWQ82_1680 [Thermosediminibacterales bacterium]|nr:hypothetical protein [Thermosediminibacterales bacterium]MDK2836276.1 hypothetical protein [Thermosediminibacterales bacterium]
MKEIKVLAPNGLLGYGFPKESFEEGMKRKPDVIAVDGGSTDPGPYYLGAGKSFTSRAGVKRDLEIILKARDEAKIPFIIGSSGGSGGSPHLQWLKEIVEEIVSEKGYKFKMALIEAEIDKNVLLEKFEEGKIKTFESKQPLTKEAIEKSEHIVAQMGVEPIIKALDMGAEVILAGRAYDPSSMAALPIKEGFDPGLTFHMCKILECGAIAAVPGSARDCLLGTLYKDHFVVEPMNPIRKCTEISVAAHTLYEKGNPLRLPGPGGELILDNVKFEQLDERRVKVSGSKFIPKEPYTVKLEGSAPVGFRTISIAGVRCPKMIKQIDDILENVNKITKENFDMPESDYNIIYHIYGKNGVMGDLEPQKEITSHELGIVIEVVGKTQDIADTICSSVRSTLLHYGYPERIATAGNLALLYSPSDIKMGPVYEFSVYHLLELEDPTEVFPVTIYQF